jgi:hypothetical protein
MDEGAHRQLPVSTQTQAGAEGVTETGPKGLEIVPRFPKRREPGERRTHQQSDALNVELCRWLENHWRTYGFSFGTRGWAYIAENTGIIKKGELKSFENWLREMREDGLLDPDAVNDDEARAADNLVTVHADDPDGYALAVRHKADSYLNGYNPISFWEGLPTYVQVMVEKVDLKLLFNRVCARYEVPLVNAKGSSDLNSRRRILQRFKEHHVAGRQCVLLYFGDLDPPGMRIADVIKNNLLRLQNVQDVQWDPSPVQVVRVGLTAEQIGALGLPWIDNLITGSGDNLADPRHAHHSYPYVQNYLKQFGARKVEANALAAHPREAADLIEAAINQYVPKDWPDKHEERLKPHLEAVHEAFAKLIKDESED